MRNGDDDRRFSGEVETSHGRVVPFSRIVLTGFMGAGKSSVGGLLSQKLCWTFLDLDRYVETFAGATARRIFASQGESAFRKLESDALALALEGADTVIALGGAAIDATENQLLLSNNPDALIVFLDAPFATLIDRCLVQERGGEAPYRPLLHKTEKAHERFLIRRLLYQDHASFAVDVSSRSAEEVALFILDTACRRQS